MRRPSGPALSALAPRRRPSPAPAAKLLAAAVAAASLAGCAVGPDYESPTFSLPALWGGASYDETVVAPEPPALASWWLRLDDPVLTALIDDAVAGNLDVATAKAKIREARASYRQAGGTLLPSLDAGGEVTRGENASGVSSSGDVRTGDPFTQFQAGFDASWELDLFGGNRRAVEAARYGLDAAEEELRAALLTLIGDVASNYVDARGFQARVALARRTAASQRETADLTRVRYDAGASSAVDVANASGQASTTEAAVPTLEASYAAAVHRLGVLTGQPPGAVAARLERPRPIPVPDLPLPVGVPADVLTTRPDVRLAERRLAQATAEIGEAEAARYPEITLVGSIGTSGSKIGDLGRTSSISWAFGPSLTVPIFNGGQLAAAVEVQEAQRDQTFIAYRQSILTALEDVENAIVSLAQERVRSRRLAASVASFREAADLSRTLYQNGASSFLDVLDAERSLYSAEDALIQSRIEITKSYVALNKALGGGWDGFVDSSTPVVVDSDTGPRLRKL